MYLCWRVAPLARVKILQMFILMNHCRMSFRARHRTINTLTALLFTSSVMSAAQLLLCLSKLQIISVFKSLPFVQNVAHFQGYFFLFKSQKVSHRDHYCFVVKKLPTFILISYRMKKRQCYSSEDQQILVDISHISVLHLFIIITAIKMEDSAARNNIIYCQTCPYQ